MCDEIGLRWLTTTLYSASFNSELAPTEHVITAVNNIGINTVKFSDSCRGNFHWTTHELESHLSWMLATVYLTSCLSTCAPGNDIVGQQLKQRFFCCNSCGNSHWDAGNHLALHERSLWHSSTVQLTATPPGVDSPLCSHKMTFIRWERDTVLKQYGLMTVDPKVSVIKTDLCNHQTIHDFPFIL